MKTLDHIREKKIPQFIFVLGKAGFVHNIMSVHVNSHDLVKFRKLLKIRHAFKSVTCANLQIVRSSVSPNLMLSRPFH